MVVMFLQNKFSFTFTLHELDIPIRSLRSYIYEPLYVFDMIYDSKFLNTATWPQSFSTPLHLAWQPVPCGWLYYDCFTLCVSYCVMCWWVYVGVFWQLCGCFVIRVLVFTMFLYCLVYVYLFLFVLSVLV